MRLLPTMALEPPPRYVAFVAAHLDPLREQAAGVAGEEAAQRLYPEVLTDVATRWRWLELLRRWLHRPQAADSYLRRAFDRRCRRWGEAASPGTPDPQVEVEVWTAERLWTERRPRPVRSSGATRIATFARPTPDDPAAPPEPDRVVLAEAAVAWWHAFEARRRRWLVGWAVAGLLLIGLIIRLHDVTAS